MSTPRSTAVILTTAAGLVLAPMAMGIGPSDFAVNIPDGPTQMGPPAGFDPTKNCPPPLPSLGSTTPPTGVYTCPGTYQWSDSATPMTGTVTVVSTGQQGTIALRCDWNLTNTMTVAVDFSKNPLSPTSSVSGFSGTGGQACSWEIKVGASSLMGTLTGTATLDQPSPQMGRFTGNLSILVVGGTGDYANAAGSGSMVQSQEFPFPTPEAPTLPGLPTGGGAPGGLPPGIPGGLPGGLPPGVSIPGQASMERALMTAVATQAGSSMQIRLRTGKPKATFLVPSGTITSTTKWKTHMSAAPKSRCAMTATKAGKTVKLGTRSSGSTGTIVGSSYAPAVLAKAGGTGNWRLRASCTKAGSTFAARPATLKLRK